MKNLSQILFFALDYWEIEVRFGDGFVNNIKHYSTAFSMPKCLSYSKLLAILFRINSKSIKNKNN